MKKRWYIPLAAAALALLLAAIGLLYLLQSGLSVSTGRCMVMENGSYMILLNGEPIQMTDRTVEGSLFSELMTGDEIEIRHDAIQETYPGKTNVYSCRLLGRGCIADIPQAVMDNLKVMGWSIAENQSTPDSYPIKAAKPVIYLYPQEPMEVSVKLELDGLLTSSYPAYGDGWLVMAYPGGTLVDTATGREHYCLFWEGIIESEYDFSEGFVIAGADTGPFLEDALGRLGLTDREANEFLIYWLPQMEANAYNLISFQQASYTDSARLSIDPQPDSLLRIFMAWKPLDTPLKVPPQQLPGFFRTGFTMVEWGGARIDS